jgi:hypothetical protein
MSRIIAFGDSFVVGDQDDFGPADINYNPKFPPTHNMPPIEREEYLKNNVSFAAIIAKKLNCEFLNKAGRGHSNFYQLDRLMRIIYNGLLTEKDTILFGITTTYRDRRSLSVNNKGINDNGLVENQNLSFVEIFDLFYIISALDQISKKYKVNIIKFNLFDNPLYSFEDHLNSFDKILETDNFLGHQFNNNTLVDILNDTWGQNYNKRPPYHTELTVSDAYKKYYTWNNHPSILGHQKIADWFLQNINWSDLIK